MKIDGWAWPLGTLVFIAGAVIFLHYQPHKSADVAAWLQAFGSIVAIAAVFAVANKQNRDAIRRERAANVDALRVSLAMFDYFADPFHGMCEFCLNRANLERNADFDRDYTTYHSGVAAFSHLRFNELRSEVFVRSFIAALEVSIRSQHVISICHGNILNEEQKQDFQRQSQNLRELRATMDAEIKRVEQA